MSAYRWPVAECLHERMQPAERVMVLGSEMTVRTEPAWCPDCGHTDRAIEGFEL